MERWNGFGGKVEKGESVEEAIRREVEEEIGIKIDDLDKVGIIEFEFENNSETLEVHIFRSESFKGELMESEEMNKPQWFHIDEIPFKEMWPDDLHWMPLFLKGKKFRGKFLMDKPSGLGHTSMIIDSELMEVEEI